jgi:transcriptional regulator with XRE-family HTH domain
MPIFPSRIREARGRMSQYALADAMSKATGRKVRQQHITKWERGGCSPSATYFDALCKVTGKSPGWFYREPAPRRAAAKAKQAKAVA